MGSGFYDNYYGYSPYEDLADLIAPEEPVAMPIMYSAPELYGLGRGGNGVGGGGYRKKRSNYKGKSFR